jgi:hypothetical protein
MFQEAVASVAGGAPIPSSHATFASGKLSALELTRLCVGLEKLSEDLASDAHVVQRHITKLQYLDLAAQALRKLAAER